MKKKLLLAEQQIIQSLKILNEQDEEMYKISPEEYMKLAELASYNLKGLARLPKFQGKKLWITGPLNLSRKPVTDLGNIGYVEGTLDISNTSVSSIGDVKTKGYVWDNGTPRERQRILRELQIKKNENQERKDENEWDINNPNIDDLGIKANVLFRYLIESGETDEMDDDKRQEIKDIENKIEELNKKYKESEESEEYNKIYDEILELEEELENLKPKIELYDIYPERYKHYGLESFEILNPDFRNKSYTVGDDDEMEEAALEYAKHYVDEVGIEGFNKSFIEDYIDKDELERYVRDSYEYDVWDNPESYFDDDDYELSDEQESRKDELENYISEMEDMKSELEDEQNEFEHNSDEYNDIDEKIQEIDSNIEKAQEELDKIEETRMEVTQDMVDQKLDSLVEDAIYDPIDYIKNYGLSLENFIDKDSLAQGLVDSDGWGVMNGYDGNYESIGSVGNKTYYVMRVQ